MLIGAIATTVGFAVVVGVPFDFELTDIFLGLVAALVALQGLRYVQCRRGMPSNTTVIDDPGVRISVPVPGADPDDDLVSAVGQGTRWVARECVADRLETRAKEALAASGGHAPEEAAVFLKTGGWIGDPAAARSLGASVSTPLRQRVRSFLSGRSSLIDRVERAIAAIEQADTTDSPAGERR